jgi:hypothetical protein
LRDHLSELLRRERVERRPVREEASDLAQAGVQRVLLDERVRMCESYRQGSAGERTADADDVHTSVLEIS